MVDPRARYFRRLRRLRRGARRWTVLAGGFGGAAAVLLPYAGVSPVDAVWAAAAGASTALAFWRWSDLRALAGQPPPPEPDPAIAAEQARLKLVATVERIPLGRAAVGEVRRQQALLELRGTAAAGVWTRLDRAARTLAGLVPRLTGPGESAQLEAAVAEQSLRDLAYRVASVEKAVRLAPADAGLANSHRVLVEQLEAGTIAYEGLVAAAANYVAEDGRAIGQHPSVSRLTEAGDLLRGVAAGLAELRQPPDPAGTSGTSR
ncbi:MULTISPECIES: phage shock envelope stress response protein PspM [unclassified Micromonospora]|uniref:phage shock envelope stress response protein PspM n=1 Tax=unclassified Micromonospora TaxID=2617518 RepID=UPI003A8C2792